MQSEQKMPKEREYKLSPHSLWLPRAMFPALWQPEELVSCTPGPLLSSSSLILCNDSQRNSFSDQASIILLEAFFGPEKK